MPKVATEFVYTSKTHNNSEIDIFKFTFTHRKQKTCPQGNCVGWLHFCKQTAQSDSVNKK